MHDRFRDRMKREFEQRRKANARYSLRAFAAFLGTDHSTLSQILKSKRPLPLGKIRAWAKKLEIDAEATAAYVAAEHLPDPQTTARENQLRHWTAEASAIIMQPLHWDIVQLCRGAESCADSRWVADRTGASIDEVNVAFARLLRLRLVRTNGKGHWRIAAGVKIDSEREFRRVALIRVREKAAEDYVKLPKTLKP